MNKKDLAAYKTNITMRSDTTENAYRKFLEIQSNTPVNEKTCIFCNQELLVKKYTHWVILKNRYPYDRLFEVSHMLAPIRHAATESDLTVAEISELRNIKLGKILKYHMIVENIGKRSSIKNHFHLHLLRFK